MAIIEVNNVTKEYRLGQLKSLKDSVVSAFDWLRGRQSERPKPFKALNDVSFNVEPGEVLGIIGPNGAGKSTLLKLLSGIAKPTIGEIKVRGSVAPLIEIGAGLVGDLTGRENVYLNGSILGMSRAEINKKFDEIVAFAELEEFIDTPIKRYSSGMSVRLGFSIATSVNADILIVDEVLAVGDLAFQRKCFDRMEDMIKRQGKTVLLVSHNIRQVERLCSRVILLDHGRILTDGKPEQVCDLFYERSDAKIKKMVTTPLGLHKNNQATTGDVELLDIFLIDGSGNRTEEIAYNSDVIVNIRFKANVQLVKPVFGIGVHTTDFLYLATQHSEEQIDQIVIKPGFYNAQCKIKQFPILPGVYALRLGIAVGDAWSTIFYAENILHFQVKLDGLKRRQAMKEGFVALEASWILEDLNNKPIQHDTENAF
jgi:ABC-type polysaccharide/polyol phosphate transport system ATPase subunit